MLILIYGITGLVGQAAARAALTAGHQVRGLARNPDKIDRDLLERLEGFTRMDGVDDLPAFNRACENVDAVISACIALPDTAVVGQIHLLRAAERAGVKVFHGASWNIDWTKLPIGYAEQYDPLILFYRFARLTSPLKLVFGFTGVILDYMFSYDEKFGPPIRKETRAATVIGEGNDIWTFTTVDDLAAYAVQAVSDPDATNEGLYYVASFQLTARDLFRIYEKLVSRMNLTKLGLRRYGCPQLLPDRKYLAN
ncbi:hypothetical protein F5883DRAFT_623459 [Diaporthe sp. PMI_573]|nr:hypothetical protein F5883DRAFT_623459 [Diaporthaceae sp. PMI_573]